MVKNLQKQKVMQIYTTNEIKMIKALKTQIFVLHLNPSMKSVQSSNEDCSFVQVFLERHPAREAAKKLVHEPLHERHQVLLDRRMGFTSDEFRFRERFVEGCDDEADVAEKGVAAVIHELQDVHRRLVKVGRSLAILLK